MRDRKNDQIHRNVAAAKLGRPLAPTEVAHHVDENKDNNAPANVEVASRGAHTAQHNRTRGLSKLRSALRMTKDGRKLY